MELRRKFKYGQIKNNSSVHQHIYVDIILLLLNKNLRIIVTSIINIKIYQHI